MHIGMSHGHPATRSADGEGKRAPSHQDTCCSIQEGLQHVWSVCGHKTSWDQNTYQRNTSEEVERAVKALQAPRESASQCLLLKHKNTSSHQKSQRQCDKHLTVNKLITSSGNILWAVMRKRKMWGQGEDPWGRRVCTFYTETTESQEDGLRRLPLFRNALAPLRKPK